MKKFSTLPIILFLSLLSLQNVAGQTRVVILGSSTAAGIGASNEANSWVGKYRAYLQGLNRNNEVINLANSGYTTYQILPSSVANRPPADQARNITRALTLAPDVIIVNMPTNDANSLYTVQEVMNNYNIIKSLADAQNVAIYFTSTQPRTSFTGAGVATTKRQLLVEIKNATQAAFGSYYLDFWTGLAAADGTIRPEYDPGDGTHLNNAAHDVLYNRVKGVASILSNTRNNLETEYINLDFGNIPPGEASWNNMTDAQTGRINNLANTNGTKSGIYAWVHDNFEGVSSNGEAIANGLPSGVSQDGFYGLGSNTNNNTGGITLGGLSAYKKYTLSFFASTTGSNYNRETKFSVQGQTFTEQTLNASANSSQFVVFNNIKADATGFITITVSAGTNNNSSGMPFYINALQATVLYDGPVVDPGLSGNILVDFGSPSITTAGNWNNLTDPKGVDVRRDLFNTTGAFTGYRIFVHDAFSAVNTNGATVHPTYPATATSDSFYGNSVAFEGNTEPTGGVTLENLDATKKYSFTFYSSRAASDNRQTQFTVTGNTIQSAVLQAANNQSNTVSVTDMLPDASGRILISVTFGPSNNNSNRFFYLGMMDIGYAPIGTLPVKLVDFKGRAAQNGVHLEWGTLSENNSSHFEILRMENGNEINLGRVNSKGNGNSINRYTFMDRTPARGANYYQLKQVDVNGTSDKSDIIVVDMEFPSSLRAWFNASADLQLQLNAESGGEAQVTLTDMAGRNLYQARISLQQGINQRTIGLNALPSGTFVLIVRVHGKTERVKILKI